LKHKAYLESHDQHGINNAEVAMPFKKHTTAGVGNLFG